MSCEAEQDDAPRTPTPFEREIDEVSRFKPADVLTFRAPLDYGCSCCGEKHCFKPACRSAA